MTINSHGWDKRQEIADRNERARLKSTLKECPLSRLDLALVGGLTACIALINSLVRFLLPDFAETLIPAISLGCGAILILAIRRREVRNLIAREKVLYQQLEALIWFSQILHPKLPLPSFGGGAISADLAALLYRELSLKGPRHIVECGAGVSTLVIGYFLQKQGRGQLVSLEHDPVWVTRVREWVHLHGLQEYVTVLECPLESIEIQHRQYQWYAKDKWTPYLLEGPTIDFVFVDGPPGWIHPCARYPALYLLRPFLSHSSTIVVDDVARANDYNMVLRWASEFNLAVEFIPCEEGAAVLTARSACSQVHQSATRTKN